MMFKPWLLIDRWLLVILLMLAAIGLLTLYSAVHHGEIHIWYRQLSYWLVGLTAFLILALIPLRLLGLLAWPVFAFALLCLALVPLMGDVQMGARRWITIGPVHLQPSEIMKWALMLVLAHWFANREPDGWLAIIVAVCLTAVPAALIVVQPDLGTSLVLLLAATAMLVAAGFPWRYLFSIVAMMPFAGWYVWLHMHQYQKQRVLTFLDPQTDPLGAGYHVIQSMISIGSGGLWGKGYLTGTQSRLNFLPEQHTDFIFSVLAEEAGLIGVFVLLLLFALLVHRMLHIASIAHTRFAALVTVGVCSIFMIYIFVNIAMVSGVLPVVGVPLPFVSYGGSALVSMLAALGMVARVSIEAHAVLPWQRGGSPLA
ncbi:MAG: rod shape-determining protein RodA [Mariprofundaceae bacterium]|nr:rod shape-determining protein RodA [Mariprofundaceae bacterium]